MSERSCSFDHVQPGKIFTVLNTGKVYLKWREPGSSHYSGRHLVHDEQQELRIRSGAPLLSSIDIGVCRPTGVIIEDLRELRPILYDADESYSVRKVANGRSR